MVTYTDTNVHVLFYFSAGIRNFLGFLWARACWRRRRTWRRV